MNADELIELDIALITTLFLTGGRIREVLNLHKRNFDFSDPEYITVKGALLEKRFLIC
jgi:integrase